MPISVLRRSRYTVPVLISLGLIASLLIYKDASDKELIRLQDDLAKLTDSQAATISNRVAACSEAIENLGNLLALHPDMDQAAFRAFARRVMSRQSAIQTLLWVPVGNALNDRLTIRYQENISNNASTQVPSNLSDLEQPLAKSRAYNVSTISGSIPLRNAENAVALLQPVQSLAGEPSAKNQLVGYLVALCSANGLAELPTHLAGMPTGEWLLLDHSATDKARRLLFYRNENAAAPSATPPTEETLGPGWHHEKLITVGDRNWILFFRPDPIQTDAARGPTPLRLFGAALAVTLFFAALLREWLHRSRLVEQAVIRRTSSLQDAQAQLEDDIRRRQQTDELLRASEQQLHSLMENSPGAIYVKDVEGRYLAVNRRFLELHGRSREDFIGRSDFELFPPDLAARVRKSDAQVMATAQPLEMEESFQLMDGTHVNLVHKFPLIDTDGAVHGVCAIASDITERKRAEAEVRESRRQLESLLGQLPGMAFRYSNDGRFTPVYISRGAAGLTGHTARDFLEKHISLEEIIHPDDRKRVRSSISSAVKKRRSFEVEYRLIDRGGHEKWVLERGQGIFDELGELLFIEGLAIDITQRKDAESEKLLVERRLLEGQKLESIGVLAGGIAHDFNNLLTGIIGNANLASLDLPQQSPIRNNLKQIEIASQRAAELCQQMLAYAGKGRFVIQPVELGQLVKSTVPLLQASISKRAKLRFDLQPDLPAVLSDPTQMRQIIMNLVINASEALGERDGEIAITTNLVRPAADWFEGAALAPADPSADFVRLEVRDTGSGMSPETITKIFEPFFTTKFTGRGLGLAAVLGIIRSHRGGLIVRSVVGKGSIFALFFPAESIRAPELTPSRGSTNTPWQRAGRVLVVDDEAHVLKVAAGMLTTSGMSVETANDGYEALDFFRANPDSFNLVLLDMTMPRLSGEETLHLLREIRPNVRVLFMSGYNRREVVDALPGHNTLGFMQKPFTLQTLRELLQQMLD